MPRQPAELRAGVHIEPVDGMASRHNGPMPPTSPPPAALLDVASALLRDLAGPGAVLREDQHAAIEALVSDRRRVLVVQATGWGKSAVYFIATRLLRNRGEGPTVLVSPLLALMRDQIAAAERIGVHAQTINSTNVEDWEAIFDRLAAGDVDLLLISPERLNHPQFRDKVLPRLAAGVGMVVVDEAHCVSDWGHDFRPDYRRIVDLLALLPDGTPVLGTTATANDRVTADVATQLGAEPLTLRGNLDRASLRLAVHHVHGVAARLAWLAEWIPAREGSGIVYCLTVADTERVAAWLRQVGIDAAAYSGKTRPDERERIEAALKANELKCVVATSALGMGYDKPDLRFVVHVGMPSSPIAYYQAIGRAGRAVERAEVVLLPSEADEAIWAYFESTALPPRGQVEQVLAVLGDAGGPMSTMALERSANLSRSRLEAMLKILDVDGAVRRVAGGYEGTGRPWEYDSARLSRVRQARVLEQEAMRRYARTGECLMAFLRGELDDPAEEPCGRCANCAGPAAHLATDGVLLHDAERFLRGLDTPLHPRKRWPAGLSQRKGNIKAEWRADIGRVLADGAGSGWDDALDALFRPDEAADDTVDEAALAEVVDGIVDVLKRWDWAQRPAWICPLPSRGRAGPVIHEVARRIGELGRLPVIAALQDTQADRPPQGEMANSTHQAANVLASLRLHEPVPPEPVLLLDDVVQSGWTLTVAADLLREAGVTRVLPLALRRL